MDNTIIIGIDIVVMLIMFLGFNKWYQNKTKNIVDELKLFKKKKEYYSEVMMVLSDSYDIVFANQAAKSLFSLDEKYNKILNSKKIELKIDTSQAADFFEVLANEVENNNNFHLQNVLLVISGKMQQVNIYVDKSGLEIDKTMTCVIDLQAVTPVEAKHVQKDGSIDFLTGLPTQFSALADINTLIIESKKKSSSFGLFLLGIDNFNDIQITLGIGYTNQILKHLAEYFVKHPPENMVIYRMDHDKFVFLIDGLDENELARNMARDLIVSIGNIYKNNNDIRLTSSVGISFYPKDGENAKKLINNVYMALDKAQKHSEANIELFNMEFQDIGVDEIKMNEEIRKGLLKNQFLLYYQPIFDLEGEIIIGAEALLRWNHPEHGVMAADKFLGIAEKTGLIVDLGEYVFDEALQQYKSCHTGTIEEFQITINLSLKEMQVEKLIPRLEMLFEKHQVARSSINLDISENIAMENIDKIASDFKLFKDFGLSLSLDHFGAGYSSFKYLSMLPLDMIKIDRSLIFDLSINSNHQITVKAIIDLAHTMGYKVVGEGVETSKEAAILSSLHCDFAQGYLYSRPLRAKELEDLLS